MEPVFVATIFIYIGTFIGKPQRISKFTIFSIFSYRLDLSLRFLVVGPTNLKHAM